MKRFRKSALFTDKKVTSTYLGNRIKKIKSGEVFVIDVGTISSLAEQSFVVGDVMKSIDEMYSMSDDLDNDDENSNRSKSGKNRQKYLLFLLMKLIDLYLNLMMY